MRSGADVLTRAHKDNISRTWRLIAPIADTAAELFYKRLFELDPRLRQMFPKDMTAQRRKLMQALHFIVNHLDWPDEEWQHNVTNQEDVFLVTLALGRRHRHLYKVEDGHYEVVGNALLWALDQGMGEAFDVEVQESWAEAFLQLSTIMKLGHDQLNVIDPGSAEVLHELSPDAECEK
jgi:hemoglobin-like flavoprotein